MTNYVRVFASIFGSSNCLVHTLNHSIRPAPRENRRHADRPRRQQHGHPDLARPLVPMWRCDSAAHKQIALASSLTRARSASTTSTDRRPVASQSEWTTPACLSLVRPTNRFNRQVLSALASFPVATLKPFHHRQSVVATVLRDPRRQRSLVAR